MKHRTHPPARRRRSRRWPARRPGVRAGALAQGKGIDEPFRDAYKQGARRQDRRLRAGGDELRPGAGLARGPEEGARAARREDRRARSELEHQCRRAGGDHADLARSPTSIVVHNPDVQTYAKLLQKAESAGHLRHADQHALGLSVGRPSSAPTGSRSARRRPPRRWSNACKGKSNKIAIVQGALSAAASAYTLKGVENVLAKNPDIKVVSSQAADWDAAKAKGDHADGAEAESRSVRHRRLLGRHGHRHRGGDQGSRPHRQGLPRDLRRRRAEGRLRPRQVGRVRPRPQLRRADAGRAHGGDDQVAAADPGKTRHGRRDRCTRR